jgi:hypothetical protein
MVFFTVKGQDNTQLKSLGIDPRPESSVVLSNFPTGICPESLVMLRMYQIFLKSQNVVFEGQIG